MIDETVKQLPEWFVDRMRRWATFRLESGAYSVPSSWPSDGPMGDSGNKGTRYWRLLGSVHNTQAALDTLPGRYRQAVMQFWILEGQGLSIREHARRRQVTHPTFTAWLRKGHVLLYVAFRQQRALRKTVMEEAARSGRAAAIRPAGAAA